MVKTSEMSMELKQELAFTKEELAELEAAKKMPITFDADCPETTPERAVKFRRVNPPRNRMDGDIEKVVSEEKIRQLSRSIMDEDSLQESEIPVLYPQSGKAHTHHTLLAC